MARAVYELHHLDWGNIGDRECVPMLRFRELASPRIKRRELSLHSPYVAELENELVVLGGGGLLNPFEWPWIVLPLLERGNRVIAWSVGHHHDHVHYPAELVGDWRASIKRYDEQYPLGQLWMASVRDSGTSFEHVPCSTCASPVFDRRYPIAHDAVIYEQSVLDPIAIEGPPRMSNRGDASLEEVAAFLGSGRCVVTNSYHGAYWAVLLGRPVLAYEPWCSKWLLTPWRLTVCTRHDWRERAPEARAFPDALDDARRRNAGFAHRVFAALNEAAEEKPGRASSGWMRQRRERRRLARERGVAV